MSIELTYNVTPRSPFMPFNPFRPGRPWRKKKKVLYCHYRKIAKRFKIPPPKMKYIQAGRANQVLLWIRQVQLVPKEKKRQAWLIGRVALDGCVGAWRWVCPTHLQDSTDWWGHRDCWKMAVIHPVTTLWQSKEPIRKMQSLFKKKGLEGLGWTQAFGNIFKPVAMCRHQSSILHFLALLESFFMESFLAKHSWLPFIDFLADKSVTDWRHVICSLGRRSD